MSLLQPNVNESSTSKGSLIQEIGVNSDKSPEIEEPTMMELMMAAQAEAKKAAELVKVEETKKQTKTFASGFKKGFLGGGKNEAPPKANLTNKSIATKENSTSTAKSTTSSAVPSNDIPTIKPGKDSSLVLDDVQEAMNDGNPLMKDIKDGSK